MCVGGGSWFLQEVTRYIEMPCVIYCLIRCLYNHDHDLPSLGVDIQDTKVENYLVFNTLVVESSQKRTVPV